MKFTAQQEYGLRCLLQIAREPEGALTIPEIAEREALTQAYVAKLLRVLRTAGVITSTRGQKGGYRLAYRAEDIAVGTVLAALGDRVYSDDHCEHYTGTEGICVHNVDCSIRALWMAVDTAVQRVLTRTTISDLLCSENALPDHSRASDNHPSAHLITVGGYA